MPLRELTRIQIVRGRFRRGGKPLVGMRRASQVAAAVATLGFPAALAGQAAAYTERGVGVVTALRGQVAVAHAPAVAAREGRPSQEPLRFRDAIFFRDVIDAQRESTAKLLLRGRSTFTLRELSRVELRESVAPAEPARTRAVVSLLTGAFRALIQRDLRPHDELEIHTPNAISAVRGSEVVVEGYRDTAPPPLPAVPGQAPSAPPPGPAPRVVTRWYVRQGELEMEGLRAGPLQGIEKVDNLPPRPFSFSQDFLERLLAPFLRAALEGSVGPHQVRLEAALLDEAAADAGRVASAAADAAALLGRFSPVGAPLPIERAVAGLAGLTGQEIFIDGIAGGFTIQMANGQFTAMTEITSRGGTLVTSESGVFTPPTGGAGAGFSAQFFRARIRLGTFGVTTISFQGLSAPGDFEAVITGPLGIFGRRLVGQAAGTYSCPVCAFPGSGTLRIIYR